MKEKAHNEYVSEKVALQSVMEEGRADASKQTNEDEKTKKNSVIDNYAH